MPVINSYLNFPGNTEEAFNFYKSVFGGEFLMISRFKDHEACKDVPAAEQDKIMHISLAIGKHNMIMGTDALESMGQKLNAGNNISLCLSVDSDQEADELFAKLGAGGTVTMPLMKMFWNAYFGMVTDKFGIQWMVNHDYNQQKQ